MRGNELSHTKKKQLIVKHMQIMETLFSQQSPQSVNDLIKSIEGDEHSYGKALFDFVWFKHFS